MFLKEGKFSLNSLNLIFFAKINNSKSRIQMYNTIVKACGEVLQKKNSIQWCKYEITKNIPNIYCCSKVWVLRGVLIGV